MYFWLYMCTLHTVVPLCHQRRCRVCTHGPSAPGVTGRDGTVPGCHGTVPGCQTRSSRLRSPGLQLVNAILAEELRVLTHSFLGKYQDKKT